MCGEGGAPVKIDGGVARNGHHRDGLDGEVQGIYLRAAVRIRVAVGVVAGSGVGVPVPGVLAAFTGGVSLVLRGVDGQVQSVNLSATVCVRVGVKIGAALGVGLPVACGPGVAAALGNGDGIVCRFIDGEVERNNTVAAVGGPVGDRVGCRAGALRVGDTVPGVAVAGRGCHYTLCGNAAGHRDGDGGRLCAATVCHSAYDSVCGGGGRTDRDRRGGFVVWIPMIRVGTTCIQRGAGS